MLEGRAAGDYRSNEIDMRRFEDLGRQGAAP